jgi:hypothetical protein
VFRQILVVARSTTTSTAAAAAAAAAASAKWLSNRVHITGEFSVNSPNAW